MRGLMLEGVKKGVVIPFLTYHLSGEESAWGVDVRRLFNNGRIRRIYISVEKPEGLTTAGIISRLKGDDPDPNVILSEISSRRGRVLIYGCYLNGTEMTLE